MTEKYTPAPWTARGNRIYDADGQEVAVATRASPRNGPHARETARLIAAAPETAAECDRLLIINAKLLAALKPFAFAAKTVVEARMSDDTPLWAPSSGHGKIPGILAGDVMQALAAYGVAIVESTDAAT